MAFDPQTHPPGRRPRCRRRRFNPRSAPASRLPHLTSVRPLELQRTARWRYGFVLQHHGAVLVKTRMALDAPRLRPRYAGDDVAAIMARELRQRTRKAWMELAFYAAVFALYLLVRYLLEWFMTRPAATRLRLGAAVALSAAFLVTASMTPYLLLGYGEPLFSSRAGPGALSSSGFIPSTAPIASAISYGILLQQALIWPLISAQWAADPLSAFLGIRESLWLVAVTFWSAIGALAAWFTCGPDALVPAQP